MVLLSEGYVTEKFIYLPATYFLRPKAARAAAEIPIRMNPKPPCSIPVSALVGAAGFGVSTGAGVVTTGIGGVGVFVGGVVGVVVGGVVGV